MNRRLAIFFFLLAVVFWFMNRGAYKGYFSDDDFDTLHWSRDLTIADAAAGILTPRLSQSNFRPTGALYYHWMGSAFGLRFSPYVGVLQALHLLNVLLLLLLLRRTGFGDWGAAAGAVFFGFHMAVFDIFWKPMYVFDLLCGTFCLLSLPAWSNGRWLLSFAAFWFAFKSKELAVLLPLGLLGYEWLLGERRWKPALPFCAASLSFGLQAMFFNQSRDNAYTLRLTPDAFLTCVSFYASKLLFLPSKAAAAIPPLGRRAAWGCLLTASTFVPLLFLPGRLFAAYLYVPLIGLAVIVAALLQRPLWVAVFCLVWLPLNFRTMIGLRKAELTIAGENRTYAEALIAYQREHPKVKTLVYDNHPQGLAPHGIRGLFGYLGHGELTLAPIDDPGKAIQSPDLAVFRWDPVLRKVAWYDRSAATPDASYIELSPDAPIWQLGEGWFIRGAGYRWIRPRATAHLYRPDGAFSFSVVVNVGPDYLRQIGHSELTVLLNGLEAGRISYTEQGWKKDTLLIPKAPAGPVEVEFRVAPELKMPDGTLFGVPIGGFGFAPVSR